MPLPMKFVQMVLGADPFISESVTISQHSLTPKGLIDSPSQKVTKATSSRNRDLVEESEHY